jgi:hypothetical protein
MDIFFEGLNILIRTFCVCADGVHKTCSFDVFNVYSLLKRENDQLGRELPLFTGQSYPCYSTEKLLPNKVLI